MTLISKIILFTVPLGVSGQTLSHLNENFVPLYVPMVPELLLEETLPDLNPKNECNFSMSSKLATKKIKHFAYDCVQPTHNWLLINTSEANYYNGLRK
tara:strand:+ start:1240 stop:1533 length:294 start_codon:yes stop_codon:yes gene_type:complete